MNPGPGPGIMFLIAVEGLFCLVLGFVFGYGLGSADRSDPRGPVAKGDSRS